MSRRAVVTGGAGFIGSHVADALLAVGYEVLVLDDLSTGIRENVPAAASFEHLDVSDGVSVESALERFDPDVVLHLAAQSSVTVSVAEPERDLASNVLGTLNVVRAAAAVSAPVVFASTGGALYGDRAPLPTPEEAPLEPLSPYGASKLAGEAYVAAWGRRYDLPNVILRLGNVYGARQRHDGEAGAVAIFVEQLRSGVQPVLYGAGAPTRDYVHVYDVARAFLAAAERPRAAVYNVGTGLETSTSDLLARLQFQMGTIRQARSEPLRPGELRRSCLDARRALAELGWEPQLTLRAGLGLTARWLA